MSCSVPQTHQSSVQCVRYFEDPTMVLTMGREGKLKVLDLRMCREIHRLSHPEFRLTSGFSSCAISPNGCYAAAGGSTGDVFVFDVKMGRLSRKLGGHAEPVTGVAWGRGDPQVTTVDKGGSVVVWD